MKPEANSNLANLNLNNFEKSFNRDKLILKMQTNNNFIKNLKTKIESIHKEKMLIDSSIQKILQELQSKEKQIDEFNKVNKALEELNLIYENDLKNLKSQISISNQKEEKLTSK